MSSAVKNERNCSDTIRRRRVCSCLMSQDSCPSALFPAPIVSRALLSSEVIEIRNCLQVLLCLEYSLEQSSVVVDNLRKIDGLLKTCTLEPLQPANPAAAT